MLLSFYYIMSLQRGSFFFGFGIVIGSVLTTLFFNQRKVKYPPYAPSTMIKPFTKTSVIPSLAVATRVFLKSDTILTNKLIQSLRGKLEAFCRQISVYCNVLFIAIDGPHQEELKSIFNPVFDVFLDGHCHIEFVVISPWNGFTAALNALIRSASLYRFGSDDKERIEFLSFQSLEISKLPPKLMRNLIGFLDEDTLVVGPVLVNAHSVGNDENESERPIESVVDLNGSNVPWNTLNVWRLNKLQPFGFSLISDGIVDGVQGGIEEVVTISMIQQLNGYQINKCKLIEFVENEENEIIWNADFGNDKDRQSYHDQKMQSKRDRAKIQMQQFVHLKPGKVTHLKC